jgi:hypothetical protein
MLVMACVMRWMLGRYCSGRARQQYGRVSANRMYAACGQPGGCPPLRRGAFVGILSEDAGLLCRFFEGLPAGSNARDKGLTPITLEHSLASGILGIDGDKGLGNLLH